MTISQSTSYFAVFFFQIDSLNFIQLVQKNLQKMMIKMINYLFNFETFEITKALFDQSLNEYLR
jgi:hypothetical protein